MRYILVITDLIQDELLDENLIANIVGINLDELDDDFKPQLKRKLKNETS